MFQGEYQHTLDPKGRVILPAKFREQLSEGVVMTVGEDYCIAVHPPDRWEQVVAGLRTLKRTDARQRSYARMLLGSVHEQELDGQGRVTVSARLREYAGLDKNLAVVGNDEHVELWDAERWATYREGGLAVFAEQDEPFGEGLF